MRASFATLALVGLVAANPIANPVPQGVTSAISPSSTAPAGCSDTYDGTFEIQVVNVTKNAKRDIQERQSTDDTTLVMSLSGGILHDSQGRTGYVAANQQFQFDKPPQTGAIYTAGFSVCNNGSLAIGGDAVWYKCLSGTFYNLYDQNDAAQCSPVYIQVIGGGSSSSGSSSATGAASQLSDGQPTASPVSSSPAVCQTVDGQPQVTKCAPVCQTVDGQPQVTVCGGSSTTGGVVQQTSDGQPQATSVAAATTGAAVSESSDGQPEATSVASPATTSAAECSQIGDGQPQCSTAAAATTSAVCEYVDGQPQAGCSSSPAGTVATSSPTVNATLSTPTPSVQPATGGASTLGVEALGLVAGVLALAML